MDLEQRLRTELERSGEETAVSPAQSIDDIAGAADSRQRRSRVLGVAAIVGVAAVLGLGVLAATSTDSSLEVAAGGAEEISQANNAQVAPDEEPDSALIEGAETAPGEDADGDVAAPAGGEAEDVGADDPSVTRQVDDSTMEVEVQRSAVELAAGSGVLVLPTDDGAYSGLATRFGSDAAAIGLASDNGLDWSEVELSGVPEGATASHLVADGDTFVAVFEAFDPGTGRQTFVGTSTDLAEWDVSAPLAGDPFATDLAVGSNGVIILGDDSAPDVWVGPVGGPYERTARLAALSVSGVTTLDGEFLVAGRSSEGATIFRSTNGIDWSGTALDSPNIPGSNPTVTVDDGIIILSNASTGGNSSLISTDGGETWDRVDTASESVVIGPNTFGFLGLSNGSASVSIADDESFVAIDLDVEAPDRLSLIAAGDGEVLLLQATEDGANWIVASR